MMKIDGIFFHRINTVRRILVESPNVGEPIATLWGDPCDDETISSSLQRRA
jgi:hypothetical protein